MSWVDGRSVGSGEVPRCPRGAIAPFETMGAQDAQLPLWDRHLARLAATAGRLGLPFEPAPELRAAAAELLVQTGQADGMLRLALVPAESALHTVMTSRPRSPLTRVRLLPTVVERGDDDPPGDLKAFPRRFYDAVLQQAQDGEADDGIVIGRDGAVLETATANLWLRCDGVWVTPPLDGSVLPGIARAVLLERASAAGLAVAERVLDLDDLHRAEAMAVSNAVYGPRPAALVGAVAPAAEVVARSLGALWPQ